MQSGKNLQSPGLASGERGIRTPGTHYRYNRLAICHFRPLSHLSELKSLSILRRLSNDSPFCAWGVQKIHVRAVSVTDARILSAVSASLHFIILRPGNNGGAGEGRASVRRVSAVGGWGKDCAVEDGRGGGIRTPGTRERSVVFKTTGFNHSPTPPCLQAARSSRVARDRPTILGGGPRSVN